MPAPTTTRADALGLLLSQIPYRETFRPATAAAQAAGDTSSTRPLSGAVYPRPAR
ncbi:hypothetical protein [Deinococcus sp. JMULE3]|uniref:hypothetical protein n=1 Tax=Deinococcus sp. JMULE3 TaxID=2518341 RepID=UPI001576124C|nr:hypothetical protein [Deinococcus sp. JMULE3]